MWARAAVRRSLPVLANNFVANGENDIRVILIGLSATSIEILSQISPMLVRPFRDKYTIHLMGCDQYALGSLVDTHPEFSRLFNFKTISIGELHEADSEITLIFAPDEHESRQLIKEILHLKPLKATYLLHQCAIDDSLKSLLCDAVRNGLVPVNINIQESLDKKLQGAEIDEDRLPRIIHEYYLESAWSRGEKLGSTPALRPWEELDDGYKDANRSQADSILLKTEIIGLGIDQNTSLQSNSKAFNIQSVSEKLAFIEHDRWSVNRIMKGWKFGEQRDDSRKLHPDLIPFEKLSEAVIDKDRSAVGSIPLLLSFDGKRCAPVINARIVSVYDPRLASQKFARTVGAMVLSEFESNVLYFEVNASSENDVLWGNRLLDAGFNVCVGNSGISAGNHSDAGYGDALFVLLSHQNLSLPGPQAPDVIHLEIVSSAKIKVTASQFEGSGIEAENG
ncbi:RyR domain-containing protein [Marinobacter sp. CHS3-4]|uniref:RyR domain-containing protein n=1 Tax=Marinobacter sp. CHS3-4 TaxID=3045174 RepID=UPI0024B55481|nr:RyR domain-containing protein [Marinobacter sp. CHS3-4]MDI9245384.1 RyR domain-containing protein [Marinobacter sp. CHS3-4]